MCKNCKEEKVAISRTHFNAEAAYSALLKRHQNLSDFIFKLVSETGIAKERSENLRELIVQYERIVGGVPVKPGEYPECCLIGTRNANGTVRWFCTGVLVHPKLVLTAAHCMQPGNSYIVALNSINFTNLSNEIINVRKSVVHPNYATQSPTFDIAGLILQTNATTSPVPLASSAELNAAGDVTLVGFGNDDILSQHGFGIKRKVTVGIVSRRLTPDEDLNMEEGRFGYESDLELVAGGNGHDTCNGDSGGPIYITHGGVRKVAGLTSRATRNSINPCGDGGIYTRTDVQAKFIQSLISSI